MNLLLRTLSGMPTYRQVLHRLLLNMENETRRRNGMAPVNPGDDPALPVEFAGSAAYKAVEVSAPDPNELLQSLLDEHVARSALNAENLLSGEQKAAIYRAIERAIANAPSASPRTEP